VSPNLFGGVLRLPGLVGFVDVGGGCCWCGVRGVRGMVKARLFRAWPLVPVWAVVLFVGANWHLDYFGALSVAFYRV